jgi:hypothetical protein
MEISETFCERVTEGKYNLSEIAVGVGVQEDELERMVTKEKVLPFQIARDIALYLNVNIMGEVLEWDDSMLSAGQYDNKYPLAFNVTSDRLFGDLAIKVKGVESTLRYPICKGYNDEFIQNINMEQYDKFLCTETLNNSVLYVNPEHLMYFKSIDDDAEESECDYFHNEIYAYYSNPLYPHRIEEDTPFFQNYIKNIISGHNYDIEFEFTHVKFRLTDGSIVYAAAIPETFTEIDREVRRDYFTFNKFIEVYDYEMQKTYIHKNQVSVIEIPKELYYMYFQCDKE